MKDSKNDILKQIDWLVEVRQRGINQIKHFIYALSTILILINFLIYGYYDIDLITKNLYTFTYYYLLFFNLMVTCFAYYNLAFRKDTLHEIAFKEYSTLDKKCFILGLLYELVFVIIALISSFHILKQDKVNLIVFYSIMIYGIRHLISFIVKIIVIFKNYIFNLKNKPTTIDNKYTIFSFLGDSLYIFITLYPIYDLLVTRYNTIEPILLKTAISINICYLIVNVLTIWFSHSYSISGLYNIKQSVLSNTLSSNDALVKLKTEYYNSIPIDLIHFSKDDIRS